MAKFYEDLIQGTPAWRKARAGVPTASKFSQLLTPKTLKLSASMKGYENQIVAEILTGRPIEDFGGNRATERGNELEPDAFDFYELTTGHECRHVGFITNDAGTFGCSPDGICGDTHGVELKCVGGAKHVEHLLSETVAYEDHKPQVQGSLLVTGFEFWDILAYFPDMAPSLYRVPRDEEYLKKLSFALEQFNENVQNKLRKIRGD